MEFVPEWKLLWPISSTFCAPLLIPNKKREAPFGPLIFTPTPNSSITLLQSPTLSPGLPPSYPQLFFSRFLQIHNSAPSISSLLGPQLPDCSSYFHGFNSLQLLQLRNKNLIVAFFPSGENSDDVGFSLLSVRDGILSVHSQVENYFRLMKEGNLNRQRITLLLVNPVDDYLGDFIAVHNYNKREIVMVGFLMVCSQYSVYWCRVGITSGSRQNEYSVCLDYLGCANAKMLRGHTVVSACWSPHVREECLVLLENGDLLLFDCNSSFRGKVRPLSLVSGNNRVIKRMQVSLTDKLGLEKEENGNEGRHWFKCEFSWHPRIFIASHRTEVFLVDLRSPRECSICSLLKLEMLSISKNDGFCLLSRSGSDGFSFTVATSNLILLCDVRKQLMPVLRWAHSIHNPQYMTVFRLSHLRANAKETDNKLASQSGYCIMLGSFWDNEFSVFCYGPDVNENVSVSSKNSKFCNSYYAWGLPSELLLSGSTCKCDSCVVGDEFMKMYLPSWIDWRQKKHLILGFGILDSDFSSQLSSDDGFGGFMLIRLMSSGKLEAQHYHATWGKEKFLEAGHKRKSIYLEDNLLYDCNFSDYDGTKKFLHFKLKFLNTYLKNRLEKYIVRRREELNESDENVQKKRIIKSEFKFHQEICHKLKEFGLPTLRPSLGVLTVLKDISLPTSIHEIALRSMCSALPTNLLQFAFSTYSNFDEDSNDHNDPLEFLDIPEQLQAPPFPFRKPSNRSNRWSTKVQPSGALVGPIIPPLFLTTLHKLCMEELKEKRDLYLEDSEAFSAHSQFEHECNKVVEVVQEHISGSDAKTQDDDFVSLADDTEHMSNTTQKLNFSCHKPSAFLESSNVDLEKPGSESFVFSTHFFRRSQDLSSELSPEIVGKELFDVGCPIELKFDDCITDFGPKEMETFRNLKKGDLDFQRSFKPYQDYITRQDG